MAGYPYAGFQHGTDGFHDVENGAHGQHTRCVEQYLPGDWSPSQHAMPYPPSSSDITGGARSGPAGNAHSVVAKAILKEIAGAFVTVPLSVAKEASRARQIVADDGVNSWKFHIGANYIGSTDKITPFTKKIPGPLFDQTWQLLD